MLESLHKSMSKESKIQEEKIKTATQRLKEMMIIANDAQKHKAFEAVLALVFESDRRSIEYFSTFHSILDLSVQHAKVFSERVNKNITYTRLLKRTLNEIIDESSRMNEFSATRVCTPGSSSTMRQSHQEHSTTDSHFAKLSPTNDVDHVL